ncbi:hypothetical protein KKF84_20725 [Myxococcota bacterium]|nr:hypothetical protein [Myxococcota bacterium]MBU1537749.1 hypothetical protein [Myxococcota bacterium]
MKKLALLFAIITLTFTQGAYAQTKPKAPKKLRFGIYAPNTAFASNSARWSYIKGVANYVQGLLKIPCSGRAFSSGGSFSGSLGGLDFALVDPIFMAMHRGSFTVLATSTYGGGSRAPWGLYAKGGGTFSSLKGKTLVLARAGGAEVSVAEGLLSGEVKVRKYFGSVKIVPDLASAVQTVINGGAHATFAPMKMASGLTLVFATSSMPNASFALVNRKLPKDIVSKVRGAVQALGGGALGGMGGAAAGGVPMGRIKATFLSAYPPILRFQFRGFLKPFKGTYNKSPLISNYYKQ